jgi:hypothetical protein
MATTVTYFALTLSGLNWLLFLGLTLMHDLPMIKKLVHHVTMTHHTTKVGGETRAEIASIDIGKTLDSSGALAAAFKKAGPAPTAAAMSLVCLLIAVIASGVAKIPDPSTTKPAPAASSSPTAALAK